MDEFTFDDIISKERWKDLLIELIVTEKLDPWNIDIVKLTDEYLEKIRNIEFSKMFMYTGNVILAAAILLRYKSDVLKYKEETEVYTEDEQMVVKGGDVLSLSFNSRFPPKKPITLKELLKEIDRVIKYEIRSTLKKTAFEPEIVSLELNVLNLEKEMDTLMEKIKHKENRTFSSLLDSESREEIIKTFLTLLHLFQKGRILLSQRKLFDDIIVGVCDGEDENN